MKTSSHYTLSAILIITISIALIPRCYGQIFGTMCTSRGFRRLSLKLQNEHQCLQMEQIQSEVLNEQTDRRKTHRTLLEQLTTLDAKLDNLLADLNDNAELWEAKWARKLKESRLEVERDNNLQYSKMFADEASPGVIGAGDDRDDSGDMDDCITDAGGGKMCPNSAVYPPFVASIDMKPIPSDCAGWQLQGVTDSGVYPIRLAGKIILVSCDMTTDDGGWTVFQRRLNGKVSFNRNWIQYKEGFGNPNSEFWLGNEYLHLLTSAKNYTLLVNVWDWDDKDAYAYYENFRVGNEVDNYPLRIGRYQGNAGDSLSYHRNMNFSTPDRDNDAWFGACARRDRAGWWFRDCGFATLNSQYHDLYNSVGRASLRDGILWYYWHKDDSQSLKKVEMKIKPMADRK